MKQIGHLLTTWICQLTVGCGILIVIHFNGQSTHAQTIAPVRTETVNPIRNETFNRNGECRIRRQGGNPRQIAGLFVFDGATDGNRQVDPQIAVGEKHVLHATNSGLIIYSKQGEFVQGVSQRCFNGGIDPKLFYDPHNQIFGFDLWNPWDQEKLKPVNISVSETSDPTGAWNTYPVPAPEGRDGGAIGFSRKWIGYTFPGGKTKTFVLRSSEARIGNKIQVYHFADFFGQPVYTQDSLDDLYFVKLSRRNLVIHRVTESPDGTPVGIQVAELPHSFEFHGWPPASPQKGTDKKTASGDRNPKNAVLQNDSLWFSHTVNCRGRAAIQWHQFKLDGQRVQSGLISHPTNSYIQTTLAVNKKNDVLVGFQETGTGMFISPRLAYRHADDPKGELREIVDFGNGLAATEGGAWGDYSGSVVDGENLLDLWTIQSVADDTGRGDTVIARLSASDIQPMDKSGSK